jgi:N-acetylmuramoyl-L-alanine amidase
MPINIQRSIARILVLTFLAAGISGYAAVAGVEPQEGIHTVVIDAGHGGKDPGAEGKKAREKDIALAIALKLGNYIEKNIPDVKVIYTRKTDVFVEFWKRAEIANKAKADLFISIHVNSFTRSYAHGTLTLVLGQHRADENFEVAVRENSVMLLEDDYETRYEGFDPHSTESYIMFSLMQKTYFKQSIEFGDFVQDQFRERAGRNDLGVREQGLIVLAQTSMPGVLVETGFISNPEEEKFLMSDYGQDIIASAIFRAFRDYKNAIDRRTNLTIAAHPRPSAEGPSADAGEIASIPVDQVVFRVQVASSRNKNPTDASSFKGYSNVQVIQDGRWYKYMVGQELDYNKALDLCSDVKSDFPDAFVVAMKNGKLMPLSDAIHEINR